VLDYEKRGKIWGLRGLSPGSQKIFTLTEGERVRNGLSKRDVVPCVPTLRSVPRVQRTLSRSTFEKHFVKAGQRCWLIRSYGEKRSDSLNAYLESVQLKPARRTPARIKRPGSNTFPILCHRYCLVRAYRVRSENINQLDWSTCRRFSLGRTCSE